MEEKINLSTYRRRYMARCKRCGASFDYDKRDGVCPRCCFYNRPPGREQTDDEWMKNYNIEDNSSQVTQDNEPIIKQIATILQLGDTRRVGNDIQCRCPFHYPDEHPSFRFFY